MLVGAKTWFQDSIPDEHVKHLAENVLKLAKVSTVRCFVMLVVTK